MHAETDTSSFAGQVSYEPITAWLGKLDFSGDSQNSALISALHDARGPSDLQICVQVKKLSPAVLWLHHKRHTVTAVRLTPTEEHSQAHSEVKRRRCLIRESHLTKIRPASTHHIEQSLSRFGVVGQHQSFDLRHQLRSFMLTDVYNVYSTIRERAVGGTYIEEWEWDEANLGYLGRRGITRRLILQVAAENPKFRVNRPGTTASHLLIGPDLGGTVWTICILEVREGRWRAFNGWPADDEEKQWHTQASRHGDQAL